MKSANPLSEPFMSILKDAFSELLPDWKISQMDEFVISRTVIRGKEVVIPLSIESNSDCDCLRCTVTFISMVGEVVADLRDIKKRLDEFYSQAETEQQEARNN